MSSTFLQLVNKVNVKLNEIELNESNFSAAKGVYAHIKESVNNSIRRINLESFAWPFNEREYSQTLVADQVYYPYPPAAKILDYETMTLLHDTTYYNLSNITYERYKKGHYVSDKSLIGSGETRRPCYIFKKGDTIGVTPVPSQGDTLEYTYWIFPDALVAATDVCSIPTSFDTVIVDGALEECYEFRSDNTAATKSANRFLAGIKDMRTLLVNTYEYITDTRV